MSVLEIVRCLAGTTVRCTIAFVLALFLVAPVLAQVDDGPTDDPYVKVPYTSATKAPSTTGDKTGGGGNSSDTVTINTIDPGHFPQICTYVTVTHNGETVTDLDADSFCVKQDGIVIDSFTVVEQTADSCITRVCLVIDRSGSMSDGGKMTAAKNAAKRFIRNMGPLDRAAVVSFGNCWTVNQNFTSDTTVLIAAVNSLTATGRTAALDGIWKGLDLASLEAGSNKAVIALSDGMENWSQNCGTGLPDGLTDPQGFSDDLTFLDNLSASIGTPVYTISLGSDFDPDYLEDIANATGGEYHHAPNNSTLDAIYDQIKISICTRYLICYTSPDTIANGDCHDVIICRDNADGDKTGNPDCYNCDTTEYCEPYPPVIAIEVDPACRRWGQPVDLCATVTDSDTPPESLVVKLYYRIFEPGGSFAEIIPTRNGNVWCYTVPAAAIPCGKDSIEYYFTASDGTTSIASPSNAPSSSHQVTICPNSPPVCEFQPGPSPAPPVCNPSSPVDFVPLNLSDIDGNLDSCYLFGDGELVPGGWQNSNPAPNTTANAYIVCIDSCGDSCWVNISRYYPPRELIPCNIPDGGDTSFFLCDPGQIAFPVTGGPGSGCEIVEGAGQLINGEWRYNATKDTSITFVVQCISLCDSCRSVYTVDIDVNEPPICDERVTKTPCDTTVYLCDPGIVCVPFAATDPDGNLDACRIVAGSGPGTLSNGYWCFDATASGSYSVTIECRDSCGETCTRVLCATVVIDEVPVLTCPDTLRLQCDDPITLGTPTVVDNGYAPSTITLLSRDSIPGQCPQSFGLRLTYVAADTCGHADTCIQYVAVTDTTDPVINCPDTSSYSCESVPVEFLPPTAVDNCDTDPAVRLLDSASVASDNCVNQYRKWLRWVARDACGNADTCDQIIYVYDSTPPDLTCPRDTTLSCTDEFPLPGGLKDVVPGAIVKGSVKWPFGVPTATDNCDDSLILFGRFGDVLDNDSCHFVFEVKYFAEDNCGNKDTCTQIVTVVDTLDPVIECPVKSRYECNNIPSSFPPPGANDACNSVTVSEISRFKRDSLCPYEYTLVIVWEAKDKCGNADTCEQLVEIFDDAAPTITVPDKVTYNCDSVPAEYPRPTAQDQCDPNPTLSLEKVDTTKDGCLLIIQLTWTATDACGNKSGDYIQYVNVIDRTAPVIACVDTLRVFECDEKPDLDLLPKPTVTDNCDTDVKLERFLASSTGACADESQLSITWVATDDCGNVDSCIQVINIVDTTPPVLVDCDTLYVFECSIETKDAQSIVPYLPTATDNCDPNPTVSYFYPGPSSGTWGCDYQITFGIYATDRCGNVSDTCFQTIKVIDTTSPVIACPDVDSVKCSQIPTFFLAPTATDNCDQQVEVTQVGQPRWGYADCPAPDTIVVTWLAVDNCENADTCEQIILVVDDGPPVLTCDDVRYECDEIPTEWPKPGVTDLCDPNPVVTLLSKSDTTQGACPQRYYFTLKWEAKDACGNADTCDQTVYVIDTTGPEVVCPNDTTIACQDIPPALLGSNVVATTSTKVPIGQYPFGTPTAKDNCDPSPEIYWFINRQDGTFPCNRYFEIGYWSLDSCGNPSDTCFQDVRIVDTIDPEIVCPADDTLECDEVPNTLKTASVGDDLKGSVGYPFGVPTATDNCNPQPSILGPFYAGITEADSCHYVFSLMYIAVDGCDNADTCFQSIRVIDTTGPVFVCPDSVVVQCNNTCKNAVLSGDYKAAFDCAKEHVVFDVRDNCDLSPTVDFVRIDILDSLCPYTFQYVLVARDRCGNASDTCFWKWTVEDTTRPRIQCPDPQRISCELVGDTSIFSSQQLGWASAYDECDNSPNVTFIGWRRQEGECPYIVRRWFYATDTCGNVSDTCYQDITVYDEGRPTIDCPDAQFFECDVDTTLFASPTAKDNCDLEPRIELVVWERTPIGDGQCAYVLRRGWHAVDDCGNYSDTCYQSITVGDTTPPVIACPRDTLVDCTELIRNGSDDPKAALDRIVNGTATKDVDGCYPYNWAFGTPTATDNCDDTIDFCLKNVTLTESDSCRDVYTLTFRGRDDCGNRSDTCTQRVTFTDSTPPVVICAKDTTVYCANVPPCFDGKTGGQSAEKFLCDFRMIDSLYDACDPEVEYQYSLSYHFEQCPRYIRAKIWAVDDCGNISDTCLWTVYFDDTVAPVIACPPDINAQCGSDPGNWGWPTATDDCGGQPTIALLDQDTLAQTACYLEVVRIFTATDFCGNADTCRQLIVVGDSTDPVISCPRDTVVSCDQAIGRETKALLESLTLKPPAKSENPCTGDYQTYDFRFGRPTATDNCADPFVCLVDVNLQYSDSCRTTFELVFVAMDACGNADTCKQLVSFVDREGPTLVCAPDTTIYCDRDKATCIQLKGEETFKLSADDKFLCGFRMVDTVYDGCCEDVEVFARLTYHLNKCPAYIKAFIWAVDCCGNYSDTCTWILNIADTAAPVINCPPDLTYDCNQAQGDWGWPTAVDNCDDNVVIKLYDQDTAVTGCSKVITRVFSATDRCKQESRCTQTITVSDTTDPVCRVPNDTTIFVCQLGQQICLPVSASDNCDQAVECIVADGAGTIVNGQWCYTPTAAGPVTAYIRCTDDCGNTCSSDFTVTIVVNESPVCNAPNDTTFYLCDPGTIGLNFSSTDINGNFKNCQLTGNSPGTLIPGANPGEYRWEYAATKDDKFCVYVVCYDSCEAYCQDTFCVVIDITEPQVCYQTPDTTVTLCNPEEICIQYDWLDPVIKQSSDAAQPFKGGKNKTSGPKQSLPTPNNPGSPLDKTLLHGCEVVSSLGYLKGDYWCWTPPDHDTVVTVQVLCADTCGHSCTNEFVVTYDMNENPICELLVDLVDPICTPQTDSVPYKSTDPEGGVITCYLVGPGELVPGYWIYPNPEPGTSATVKIVCADTCGDSCVVDFTRNYPQRVPGECRVPDDIDTVICQPTLLSFPVGSVQGATCTVISGPGSIDVGNWFYYADRDTSFCVTIECKSLCDSCRADFCVTIDMNDPPVCQLPNDTTIFICDTVTVCLPVGASDPNGNFSHCTINDDKGHDYGYVSDGMWCYFASQSGSVTVPIICFDSCGAICEGSFTVTFVRNESPVCQLPNDTTIFLCEPGTVCLPLGATDVNGNFMVCEFDAPSKGNGYGYIVDGKWCYDVTEDAQVTAYIVCYDSCRAYCYGDFTVTFNLNEPPTCNEIADTSVFLCEPTPICIPVGGKDRDGDVPTCQVVSGPGTVAQGLWCFTPTQDGVYNVTIRCTDSCGAYCDESFSVTVSMNEPPVCISPPTDTTIYLCEATNVCIYGWGGSDADGNLVECILLDDDKGVNTPNGLAWCDFIAADQTVLITIQCRDSCGATCTRDVYVNFVLNLPPVINLGADISTQVGDGQVCFNYTVSDPDGPEGLTEQLLLSPAGAVIDTAANTICWTPEEGGNFMFVGQVIDSCGATDFDTAFVLVSQPAPPVCFIPNDTTITLCNLQQISLPVSGTSLNPPVNCAVTSGPGSVSGGYWRFTPTSAGQYDVTITCTDAQGGQCNGSFSVTVLLNQEPICNVRDTSVFICDVGTQICIPVSGTDPEGGTVTCTKISGPGTLANGMWCYTANSDATFTVTFRCTDPCGRTCEKTVTITINMNEAPQCTVPYNQTVIICPGDAICINLSSIDLDGNLDTCGIKDGLGEVLPNGPNGQYRWCYTPTGPGIVPVTIFCADICGDTCFTPRQYTVLFNTPDICGTQQQGRVIVIGPAAISTSGDVNGSGDINVADLAVLAAIVQQRNIKGQTATLDVTSAAAGYQYNGDVNCDGKVDRADVAFLTEYIFNAGPEPCVPEE